MNKEELKKLEEIYLRQEKNLLVFSQVASYLNNAPCAMTKELMREITDNNKDYEDYSYAMFLSNIFTDDEKLASELLKEYYIKSVKRLDEKEYIENPYYKSIRIPNKKIGKWTLGSQSYQPYEAFIRDDIIIDGYKEIPQIGYFDKEFTFPTVFESGVEWMAIKPNEIETMKEAISEAQGSVLVYGLGLGYYAYMISLKDNVTDITIIERDESVIKLFKEYILPQFENKNKIKIIQYDAFEYAKKEASKQKYSFVFVDLWHDVSDGTEMYMQMKKLEKHLPNAKFSYWIEKSILSAVRVRIFETLYNNVKENKFNKDLTELERMLTDEFLKNLINNG
ncbi:MAG: hypothetical protein II984_01295 [Clostridia bacterium]|nr:hypothetical protein [Clostridia bacterium]